MLLDVRRAVLEATEENSRFKVRFTHRRSVTTQIFQRVTIGDRYVFPFRQFQHLVSVHADGSRTGRSSYEKIERAQFEEKKYNRHQPNIPT